MGGRGGQFAGAVRPGGSRVGGAEPRRLGGIDRRGGAEQWPVGLFVDVEDDPVGVEGQGGAEGAAEDEVGAGGEEEAVLQAAGLVLRAVDHDHPRSGLRQGRLPLGPQGEGGAAAAPQSRHRHLGPEPFRPPAGHLLEPGEADGGIEDAAVLDGRWHDAGPSPARGPGRGIRRSSPRGSRGGPRRGPG